MPYRTQNKINIYNSRYYLEMTTYSTDNNHYDTKQYLQYHTYNSHTNIIIIIVLYLPSEFRVAYAANISEPTQHIPNHENIDTKTRPQHPLLFANSEWVL